MLSDDILKVDQRIDRMQVSVEALRAEVQELAACVADARKRLDMVDVAANPAKVAIDRLMKSPKKAER